MTAFSKASNLLKSGSKIVPTVSQKKETACKILILQAVFDLKKLLIVFID